MAAAAESCADTDRLAVLLQAYQYQHSSLPLPPCAGSRIGRSTCWVAVVGNPRADLCGMSAGSCSSAGTRGSTCWQLSAWQAVVLPGGASCICLYTWQGLSWELRVVVADISPTLPCAFMCRHGPHEEEEVVYERLPSDIARRSVLLMDPLVGTGRTACRAVQVRDTSRRSGRQP